MDSQINIDNCIKLYDLCCNNQLSEAQLLFLSTNKTDYDVKLVTDCFDQACAFGRLELAQWLHQNYPDMLRKYNLECACHNGHILTVKWILNTKPILHQDKRRSRVLALINGQFDILELLLLDNIM